MSDAPAEVDALARGRAEARAARDFATADELRAEIAALGWSVLDRPDGFELEPLPPWQVLADLDAVASTPSSLSASRRATVALLVEGWPDDVRACLDSLLAHVPTDVGVVALDTGNLDGAGEIAQSFATVHAQRVEVLHLGAPVRFGPARAALLRRDDAAIHIWIEPSTVLAGDALTPLLAAF